jgi:adenosylhomocysteine nucleosidase
MKLPTLLAVVLALALGPPAGRAETPTARPLTAILTALDAEHQAIEKAMQDRAPRRVLGFAFQTGRIKGRPVLLAKTGIGKVNAAQVTLLAIQRFEPTEVLFAGIAGGVSPDLEPGDLVVSRKVLQHDLGTLTDERFSPEPFNTAFNGDRPPLFLAASARLLGAAKAAAAKVSLEEVPLPDGSRTPRVLRGVLASGDTFVASAKKKQELRDRWGADAVEMEGAAVAQVCWQQGVPFLVIRSVSDSADRLAENDLKKFLPVAARNAAALAVAVVEELNAAGN